MTENLRNAITLMINEEIVKAKDIIHNDLYAKLGKALEEKLMEYAPAVFNEAKHKKDEDEDEDEDETEDSEDEKSDDEDDDDDEENDKEMNEEYFEYDDEDDDMLKEALEKLIVDIENQQGRELTNEEIEYVADAFIDEYYSAVNEEKMSDEEFAAQAEPKNKATFADRLALIKRKQATKTKKDED